MTEDEKYRDKRLNLIFILLQNVIIISGMAWLYTLTDSAWVFLMLFFLVYPSTEKKKE